MSINLKKEILKNREDANGIESILNVYRVNE